MLESAYAGWIGGEMLQNLLQDLRHAMRVLARDRVLMSTAAAKLAICIGANTTVYSILNTVLLRPLPYPGSERIDWISDVSGKRRTDMGTRHGLHRLALSKTPGPHVSAFCA